MFPILIHLNQIRPKNLNPDPSCFLLLPGFNTYKFILKLQDFSIKRRHRYNVVNLLKQKKVRTGKQKYVELVCGALTFIIFLKTRLPRSETHLKMRMARQAGLLRLVGLHLNLVAGRQEGVEAHDELGMSLEEHRNAGDDTGGVNRLRLELLQEFRM